MSGLWRFDPFVLTVGDVVHVAEPFGWDSHRVTDWEVTKVTAKGQVAIKHGARSERLNASGKLLGGYSRASAVSADEADAIRLDNRIAELWRIAEKAVAEADTACRRHVRDLAKLDQALAQISEARAAIARATGEA